MSVWREVQEALYQRWQDQWVNNALPPAALTAFTFANETFDPPDGPWADVRVQERVSAQETLGRPGNRKVDRQGAVIVLLREPPGDGAGRLSDLAAKARAIFECCRLAPHDIRFNACQIGQAAQLQDGGWWGVAVDCPFAYEELI